MNRKILRMGSMGENVEELGQLLAALGYRVGSTPGKFDQRTRSGVMAFQNDHGLVMDGVVAANTWRALDRMRLYMAPTFQSPREKEIEKETPPDAVPRQVPMYLEEIAAASVSDIGALGPADSAPAMSAGEGVSPVAPAEDIPTLASDWETGGEILSVAMWADTLPFFEDGRAETEHAAENTAWVAAASQTAADLNSGVVVSPLTWAALGSAQIESREEEAPTAEPLLQMGAAGRYVTRLQQRMTTLGYDPGPIDGIFGSRTRMAVIAFQNARGLDPDGIVGPVTWAVLEAATPLPEAAGVTGGERPTLRYGDSGPYVSELQTELMALLHYAGPISGLFDAATLIAVRSFQDASRLLPDGIVGRNTWNALTAPLPPSVAYRKQSGGGGWPLPGARPGDTVNTPL